MTARPQDVALLPLPERLEKIASYTEGLGFTAIHSSGGGEPVTITPVPGSIREAAAAIASAQAREEELRAEVDKWSSTAVFGACGLSDHLTAMEERATAAEARAERLEEALREAEPIVEWAETEAYSEFSDYELSARCENLLVTIRSLLSTNAATQTGETT